MCVCVFIYTLKLKVSGFNFNNSKSNFATNHLLVCDGLFSYFIVSTKGQNNNFKYMVIMLLNRTVYSTTKIV